MQIILLGVFKRRRVLLRY